MKCLEEVKKIFESYDLKPIELPDKYVDIYQYIRENPNVIDDYKSDKTDSYFIEKYNDYIPYGWYGFSIGTPVPTNWLDIIDDILELCIKYDPKFEIHQIKMKFGRICFYCESDVIEDIWDIESYIENILYDRTLIF